jgi:hypothetical protein
LLQKINRAEGRQTEPERILTGLPETKGKPLLDPFSKAGTPYRFDKTQNRFYSVGEDGTDSHVSTTSGTVVQSFGDDITMPMDQVDAGTTIPARRKRVSAPMADVAI